MFYKPNYCCHCGEKIEKAEFSWIKDSGRFCDVCRNDFPFQEFMPKVFIALCAVFGIFGIGSYLISGDSTANAVAYKQSKTSAPRNVAKTENADSNSAQNLNRNNNVQIAPKTEPESRQTANRDGGESKKAEAVKAVEEKTYFCGAATKKGTPCSRKVKGGGRCWQHEGQEAMLAQEKLLIRQ